MPKVSKDSVAPNAQGPGTEWAEKLDGYSVSIVETAADADLTELLKGLPGDECPSPHWGYVLKGRMWFRSGDREESFGAGDAFYVAPGHVSGADGKSEFVVFSPTEIMAEVEAHMMQRAREMHGA
jgi:quercetin dioxygenase-like cupin family protein